MVIDMYGIIQNSYGFSSSSEARDLINSNLRNLKIITEEEFISPLKEREQQEKLSLIINQLEGINYQNFKILRNLNNPNEIYFLGLYTNQNGTKEVQMIPVVGGCGNKTIVLDLQDNSARIQTLSDDGLINEKVRLDGTISANYYDSNAVKYLSEQGFTFPLFDDIYDLAFKHYLNPDEGIEIRPHKKFNKKTHLEIFRSKDGHDMAIEEMDIGEHDNAYGVYTQYKDGFGKSNGHSK